MIYVWFPVTIKILLPFPERIKNALRLPFVMQLSAIPLCRKMQRHLLQGRTAWKRTQPRPLIQRHTHSFLPPLAKVSTKRSFGI